MKKSLFILIASIIFQSSNAFAAKGVFVSSGKTNTKTYQKFDQTKMRKSGNQGAYEVPLNEQANKEIGKKIISDLKSKPSKEEYEQAKRLASMFQKN